MRLASQPRVTALYRIAEGVHVRRLDDEMAVYLAQRFETHLLDDVGAQVLEAMQAMRSSVQPCTVFSLYRQLTLDPAHTLASADVAPGDGNVIPIPEDSNSETETQAEVVLMPLLNELVRLGVVTTEAC